MPIQDTESNVASDEQDTTSASSTTEYFKEGKPLSWLKRGIWAVGDQALFAGSNFVLNILLARWLLPQGYGAYVTALTAYTLVIVIHRSLLSKPMLVFGSGRYEARFEEYLGALLFGHVGFCVASGIVLALTSFALPYVVGKSVVAPWLSFALMCPFVLLPYFTRKACYAVHRPLLAAQASALYLVVLLMLLYITHRGWNALTPTSAFRIMGAAGLVSGVAVVVVLKPKFSRLQWSDAFVQSVTRAHWNYGRWTTASGFMGWTPGQIWYLVLPAWIGLEAGGTLRALMNFTLPIDHTLSALGTVLVPTYVASRKQSAKRYALLFWGCLILFGGTAVLYWGLVSNYGETLVAWVYDGKYAAKSHLLVILCFIPVVKVLITVASSSLHSNERPDLVFYGSVASFALTLTLGLTLTYVYGLAGAAWGNLFAAMAMAGLVMFFAIRGLPQIPD